MRWPYMSTGDSAHISAPNMTSKEIRSPSSKCVCRTKLNCTLVVALLVSKVMVSVVMCAVLKAHVCILLFICDGGA